MTQIPGHVLCPPTDIPILDWWMGCYDHVFVVFNPFFRVPGYGPETAAFGPVRTGSLSVAEIVGLVTGPTPERPNAAPDDFGDLIKAQGRPVAWRRVAEAVGAGDFTAFCRTVWLWTLQVERPDRDPQMAGALSRYCRETATYPPEEDMLPAILEPALGRFLAALGISEAQLWSEWRDVSKTVPVSALRASAPRVELPGEKLCAVSAPGFLIAWAFDDVAGLLCLSQELRDRADPSAYFEGFPVTEGMYSDVFNPVDRAPRQPPCNRH
ncbi:hypothetical protein LCL97_22505 [Seohaeicola saemankumensis]|nr:hypothetical protein [Seohaeicola saemankumensis]MCA0873614.1 hypothetical protein [Seohaeicola saemankumensis]